MPKLRKGDIVTFKAIVTDVADYNSAQQICAVLLPKGKTLGWCVPGEYDFAPVELKIRVGDFVNDQDRPCHEGGFEVMAIFEHGQVAVKKPGNWPVSIVNLNKLVRR